MDLSSLFDGAALAPLLLLGVLALFAGFVDAVVGGGGLIQVPALFAVHPQTAPALLFGTNKVASVAGTATAAWRLARRVPLHWAMLGPALAGALLGAFGGAAAVSYLPVAAVRPAVLLLLIVVAIYTFAKKDLGVHRGVALGRRAQIGLGALVGLSLGFYDGFFGPGTGAFLIFLFVRLFRYDFLQASAHAKLVNMATNIAALAWFIPTGAVLWLTALVMAACNVVGALIGTHMALKRGAGFVRSVFLAVLVMLIARFAWDTWRLG